MLCYLEPRGNLVVTSAVANPVSGVNPWPALEGRSSTLSRSCKSTSDTAIRACEHNWKRQENTPRQHDVAAIVFSPLPVLAGVHGEMKGQHFVLRVGERDHDC